MKINKKQLEEIIELIQDWTDYDVEGNYLYGYDVVPHINKSIKEDLLKEVNKIIQAK